MAFKLDFTTLSRPRSAEEIEANYQAQRAQARMDDAKKREGFSTKTLALTITEVESRHAMNGGREIHLWGTQPDGRTARATLYFGDCYDREASDPIFEELYDNRGDRTLHGYWKSYQNDAGKKFWTFRAQKIDGVTIAA